MTDAELLAAWATGDKSAGSRLFDRHYRSVYRFFANKVNSSVEVEDLVQRTFLTCVESRANFRGDSSFRTFMFGVARNILLRHLSGARPGVDAASTSLADCGLGVSTVVHLRREHQLLLTALRRIPIDSQALLEMAYWEQMPAREIATVLGLTEPAVRSRMRKAKLELRGAIEGIARTRTELDSTIDGIEKWAEGLRVYWQDA